MTALYEIVQQLKELESMDDVPADLMRDTIEGLEGDLANKVKQVAYVIRNLGSYEKATAEEAAAMKARSDRVKRRGESLKNYLLFSIQAAGAKKFDFPEFTVSVRDNPESVVINEDIELPPQYMRQPDPPPPQPDKDKLKAALKAGEEIRGVWLQRGQHVRITT